MGYKFAIIGGGLTATSFLCQLVDKLHLRGNQEKRRPSELALVVFEKKDIFGPGLPHCDRYVLPFHITNMCAKDMSVRSAEPGDFQNWVHNNRDALKSLYPDLRTAFACPDCYPQQCRHYPRAVMGEYLKSRFQEAVQNARKLGTAVKLHPNTEVIDLCEQDEHIRLRFRNSSAGSSSVCDVDGVLLATGHWFEEPVHENYFTSPWPASNLLSGIPAGETVGVIGSSLSAIEVALTLTADGRFVRRSSGELSFEPPNDPRKVVFYSRQGILPRVRGRSGRRPNRYLTCDAIRQMVSDIPGRVTLSAVFELLDRELKAAYGSPFDWRKVIGTPGDAAHRLRRHIQEASRGDGPDGELIWQTVLLEIFPVVRELYLNLSLSERKRFDRDFTTAFFMHAATQPVINAEKLLALMDAGIVSIVKLGNDYRFEHLTSGKFQFTFRDPQGRERQDLYRYVVNARGQPRSIESDSAELTRNLLMRGHVQIEETMGGVPAPPTHPEAVPGAAPDRFSYKTGSIVVDPETHRVAGNDQFSKPVYAVGAMTRGQIIDASMANGIARSTGTIADRIITELYRNDAV